MRGGSAEDCALTVISHRHLAAFVELARCGSFTRAAAAVGLSQPALTLAVQQLEASHEVVLFERTTRRVHLTQTGEAILPAAQAACASFEKAMKTLRDVSEGKQGRVRLASVPSFVVRVLPRVLKEFERDFPNVTIHIREENETEVARRVQEGDADFGFGGNFEVQPDLSYQPLVEDEVGLLCRSDHSLARSRKPLAWRDLAGLRFAAFGPQTTLRRLVERVGGLPREVLEPAYEVADVITLESLLEADLAVATAFKLGMYRGRDRKLVFRPLLDPALTRTICLIKHGERTLSPAATALVNFTLTHLSRRTDGFRIDRPAEGRPSSTAKPAPGGSKGHMPSSARRHGSGRTHP